MLYKNIDNQASLDTKTACQLAGINPNTYHYEGKTQPDSEALLSCIKRIAKKNPRYGYRRITKALPPEYRANHKKVLKIMREHKLLAKKRKAFRPTTTNSNHGFVVHPNRIRSIEVTRLNQIWVSDITYIPLGHGFAYLAVVLDVFSRKCIGWQLSKNIDAQLTTEALEMALQNRKNMNLDGLIHHSDRGSQYACHEHISLLEQNGILVSMSRSGNPYDNAFAESFIKTLKYDEVYLNEYETFEDAYENIEYFIDQKYNPERLHSGIGYLSPDAFEKQCKLKEVCA
jgi:transposase InsO family protein